MKSNFLSVKIQHIIPLLVLSGCCAVNAQTTNITANTSIPTLFTKGQAESLATRLANEKEREIYKEQNNLKYVDPSMVVFGTNQPPPWGVGDGATIIETRFADGHWISTFRKSFLMTHYTATVELAPDGSAISVSANVHGGLP